MLVKELIEELKKCPQDAIVMYDIKNAIMNDSEEDVLWKPWEFKETHCGVDDVMIGQGTLKGFVYLSEELLS